MAKQKSASKPKAAAFNVARLKADVDTYEEGVYALVGFINQARWNERKRALDESVKFGVGRRLRTSKANRISPDTVVTPDCAIQLTPKLGVVAEAKPGVSRSESIWEANIAQLQKYDDTLSGWWTADGFVAGHDLVVLVPMARVVDFVDLLKRLMDGGAVKFERKLAVVAFYKSTGAEVFINLKSEYGSISDADFSERLRRAIPINWERLLVTYNDRKFSDFEPPLPYTLWVLWDYVLASKATGRQAESGQNHILIETDVPSLTAEVQKFYGFPSDGPGSVEIPKQKWIRRALDALVVFRIADHVDQKYRVKYKRKRGNVDTIANFGRLCHQNRDRLALAAAPKPILQALDGIADEDLDG